MQPCYGTMDHWDGTNEKCDVVIHHFDDTSQHCVERMEYRAVKIKHFDVIL